MDFFVAVVLNINKKYKIFYFTMFVDCLTIFTLNDNIKLMWKTTKYKKGRKI